MWLVGFRDLQYRRRRFLIAVLATAVVFAMTLVMAGMSHGLDQEITRLVGSFQADRWVVAPGASGPFTTTKFLSADEAASVKDAPGVKATAPVIVGRGTVGTTSLTDVNVIGTATHGLGAPPITSGRAARGPGEAVVDSKLDVGIGDTIRVSGLPLKVVGKTEDLRFNFGQHVVFLTPKDARDLTFAGQPLSSAVITRGIPTSPIPGLRVLTNDDVESDMARTLKSGKSTIDLVQFLLWIVAAGIIGLMVYLTALERVRDFAVLKATGASNGTLYGALSFQAVVLSVGAALAAMVLSFGLAPLFPFRIAIAPSSYIILIGVAIVVGAVASLGGLRRAVSVDPAVAFGNA
jgi:putative ABC transport system permease protein